MRSYYDLHMHSCLSPCASNDMTPNNIVNMCRLTGLNTIALTDHNTSLNCQAVEKLCREHGICFVPGMELSTSEEIHVVCLFKTLEKANEFGAYVEKHQMHIQNRPDIYGEQIIMNRLDEPTGKLSRLLWVATDISIMSVKMLTEQYGGTCFPAHIDRQSNSVISILGDIPVECGFKTAEIADERNLKTLKNKFTVLNQYKILFNSDAHTLDKIKEKGDFFEIDCLTPDSIINYL